ncbi:MAG: hypothetical protein IKJ35_08770 [Clostridia bacterium]|nr:hypothetical protein [Clostridia bacterium]
MKKYCKLLLLTVLLVSTILILAACANWEKPYTSADADGYTVSVRFDANGGRFAGTNDVSVIDVFNPNKAPTNTDGKAEITLITPDDSRRESNAFEVSNTGYFLAGWYRERALRTDENGNPLDEDGNLCSESNKEQGYVYGGRWDFDKDRLEVDPNASHSSSEPVITLYAAWVPDYTYEFYALDSETNQFTLLKSQKLQQELELPRWEDNAVKINMKKFPTVEGKTFDKAYLDPEMTQEITERIGGSVDYEKGISNTKTIKIYTTWIEGEWFRIYTAKQFYDNSRLGGNYLICADLDFTNQPWAPSLAKGEFRGTILGGGHKFSNITVKQGDARQEAGGLFGKLHASAKIEDLTIENVTYTFSGSINPTGAAFGLLAGTIADGATLSNVSVSGKLQIDAENLITDYGLQGHYEIGLLCGEGTYADLSTDGIICELIRNEKNKFAFTVNEDKTVTLIQNETNSEQ